MNKGELYVTEGNQERLVIGQTPAGDVAYASRGGNIQNDYNSCQIVSKATFQGACRYERTVSATELARVQNLFAGFIAANNIK